MSCLEPCPTCTEICPFCPRCVPQGDKPLYKEKFLAKDLSGQSPPSSMERVVNFTRAVANHAMAGFPMLSGEETEARLAICRECPKYVERTCSICGCNMRVKASWKEQECPLGKWTVLTGESMMVS